MCEPPVKIQRTMNNHRSRDADSTQCHRSIVMFAATPVEELDIVGPWEVFATANSVRGDKGKAYDLQLVTTARDESFRGDSGLTLSATRNLDEVAGNIDTLMVPGGTGPRSVCDATNLAWLRSAAARARRVASVCTGAFLLAQAGLLDGRRATTHWMFARDLARRYPRIRVDADPIYIRDGNVYTSAGVTAGMDLALALVEEDLGNNVALEVARRLVLFARRPGGQAQFSALLAAQASDNKAVRELLVWISEHLRSNLSVESMAARVAMSSRNFARVFLRETRMTPAHFVERMRIEAACRNLEATDEGLEAIAARAGFGSAEVMRRAFRRHLGLSPNLCRQRLS